MRSEPRPQTEEAYELLHDASVSLARVEANGIRIDEPYLDATLREVAAKIAVLRESLEKTDFWAAWRKRYGTDSNLGSRQQLGEVLFNVLGYAEAGRTASRKIKTDVDALATVDHPFVRDYVQMARLEKLHGTYLLGIKREVVGGYLHCFFHNHTVRSYRGSSSDINFQNLPIRDAVLGSMLRRAFVPSPGHLIVENDFKAIEVGTAGIYTQDQVLCDYIRDPKKDMHRDCAAKLFFVDDPAFWKTAHGKNARYVGKNGYVFPGFYGSDYINITSNLVDGLAEKGVVIGGVPAWEWICRQGGITSVGDCVRRRDGERAEPVLGSYERHVRDFERWYWDVQYAGYSQWKRDWYAAYLRTGGFSSLVGFHWSGLFERNQVLNYPIQGTAYHILLWVLIRMQRWLEKSRMRSKIVGQIHDSIIADVHPDEKDDYLAKIKDLVSDKLQKYWTWINVPMTIEAEVTEVDAGWNTKREVAI